MSTYILRCVFYVSNNVLLVLQNDPNMKIPVQVKEGVQEDLEKLQADNKVLQQSLAETNSQLSAEMEARRVSEEKVRCLNCELTELKKQMVGQSF